MLPLLGFEQSNSGRCAVSVTLCVIVEKHIRRQRCRDNVWLQATRSAEEKSLAPFDVGRILACARVEDAWPHESTVAAHQSPGTQVASKLSPSSSSARQNTIEVTPARVTSQSQPIQLINGVISAASAASAAT